VTVLEPGHEAELAGGDTDEMCELAERAIETAASDLVLNPLLFARELAQGEIGLLISYLRAAARHVDDLDLRVRIDRLLHRLTDWTQDAE
jgi:plasmid stabilization system protein ParE